MIVPAMLSLERWCSGHKAAFAARICSSVRADCSSPALRSCVDVVQPTLLLLYDGRQRGERVRLAFETALQLGNLPLTTVDACAR
eukprot:1541200-Pleurochrysis_carterae.AAC.4